MTTPLVTLRASAVLLGGGNYDVLATAKALPCRGARSLELYFDYTRGTSGGAFKIQIWTSRDGTNFYPRTLTDGASNSAGSVNVNVLQLKLEASTVVGDQPLSYIVEGLEQVAAVKILPAEYGATGTPGTLGITGSLG